MKKIKINASKSYEVIIGKYLLDMTGELISEIKKPCTAMIITDDNVAPLYLERVELSLNKANFEVKKIIIKNGENSKTTSVLVDILEKCADENLTRSDLIIALGGGVVGDISGFAASVYLRGISFVNIPTTFLAAIDSSVGGKTAVNLDAGKNLCGTFYQPERVIVDVKTFDTLTEDIYRDGIAEAIKYMMISESRVLYESLSKVKFPSENINIEEIVAECVSIKNEYITKDEFDLGLRQKLNFGHSIGHAVERAANFQISHGKAVAIGMAYISRLTNIDVYHELIKILELQNLPIITDISTSRLTELMLHDKKRSGDKINLIIPKRIGECIIKSYMLSELEALMKGGEDSGNQ